MAKILICEDEKMIQKVFLGFLRQTDYEVHIAGSGIEGMALAERELPDLILTDLSMPEGDGFVLATMLKENPVLATIPIIFVTGFAQKDDVEEATKYNPAGYLVKPFTGAGLREAIATALSLR